MMTCTELERLATPYLDGEVAADDRDAIDGHLKVCPPCRTRIEAEGLARTLLHARRAAFAVPAPPTLRARCARAAAGGGASAWRRRAVPLSLAATLVLALGGYVLYAASGRSDTLLAAELTLDHVKCFALQQAGTPAVNLASIDSSLARRFGWTAGAPAGGGGAPIQLVGERRCFYADGSVAHLLYRHDGRAISLYLVPNTARARHVLSVLGHEALIWPEHDWTCVLIGREPPREMQQIAAYVRQTIGQ